MILNKREIIGYYKRGESKPYILVKLQSLDSLSTYNNIVY